ncbi:uncharacterized protein LOC127870500 [Dreissena polymorpha]|uniref:uncharacterized protein LOC127870500 n=1 Tax=Dreissena polymorpha TaxID=45954 RepID=UPI002264568A|nr:uncharacterized protein LOC127870500 [Dreissena polymorpha]
MENISKLFIILCFGYTFAKVPELRFHKGNLSQVDDKIVCHVANFSNVLIRFLKTNQPIADIWNNGRSCETNYLTTDTFRCGCDGELNAECNISMNSYIGECTFWRCEALQNGLIVSSAPVNVCLPGLTTDVTEMANCSTASPLSWISDIKVAIGGFTLEMNDTLFPLKTYSIDNITALINSFHRENNGSIIVCKLDERKNEKWSLTILYPPELCSLWNTTTNTSTAKHDSCIKLRGNPNVTLTYVQHSGRCQSSSSSSTPGVVTSSICEAVNRNDIGSLKLVGDKSGRFQPEILDPANIQIFSVNGLSLKNFKFNVTQELEFKCLGNGNPPPKMKLFKDGSEIWSEYTFLRQKLPLSGLRDSGNYTCVSSNALGIANETIIVSYEIERQIDQDLRLDSSSSIDNGIILAGASALVLLVIIAAATCVYKMYRRMMSMGIALNTQQSILPMTYRIDADQIDNNVNDSPALPDQI